MFVTFIHFMDFRTITCMSGLHFTVRKKNSFVNILSVAMAPLEDK